jgi:hypothetical protein
MLGTVAGDVKWDSIFSRIHPGRCINHIEQTAPKNGKRLPTRGGSSSWALKWDTICFFVPFGMTLGRCVFFIFLLYL